MRARARARARVCPGAYIPEVVLSQGKSCILVFPAKTSPVFAFKPVSLSPLAFGTEVRQVTNGFKQIGRETDS